MTLSLFLGILLLGVLLLLVFKLNETRKIIDNMLELERVRLERVKLLLAENEKRIAQSQELLQTIKQ